MDRIQPRRPRHLDCTVFWPARVAERKGHSFWGYFFLSVFFFPLSLIMAYLCEDRSYSAVVR